MATPTLANKAAERDFRLASLVCDRHVYLRFTVAGIAQRAVDNPGWDTAAIARDLNAALDRVEQG
jgi:hypothetical protein